jgi:chemotaxis protein methyltransferase CheR
MSEMSEMSTSKAAGVSQDGAWPGPAEGAGGLDYLNPREFDAMAKFIEGYSGIKMPPSKKTMMECRLRRRAQALGMHSLKEYVDFLFHKNGFAEEATDLIDAVTTNKTDFFREPKHFDFLRDEAVPLLAELGYLDRPPLKVWSAAASIGAEAFPLAMVLAEMRDIVPHFSILGTDISTQVLKAGAEAIYPEAMADEVPDEYRRRYMLRGKGSASAKVRIVPELRRTVRFQHLNLMDASYNVDRDMHVVFCRNILIYFDKATQMKVLSQIGRHIVRGGFLFLGHSETVAGFDLPFVQVAPSVFRTE